MGVRSLSLGKDWHWLRRPISYCVHNSKSWKWGSQRPWPEGFFFPRRGSVTYRSRQRKKKPSGTQGTTWTASKRTQGQCESQTEFRNDMPLVNESVILTMDLSALSKPVSETKVSDKIVGTLIVFLSRPNRKLPLRTWKPSKFTTELMRFSKNNNSLYTCARLLYYTLVHRKQLTKERLWAGDGFWRDILAVEVA